MVFTVDDDFRYGQLAMEGRLITVEQFDSCMTRAKASNQTLANVLVKDGIIDTNTAARLAKALSRILRDERAKSEAGMLAHRQIGGYRILKRVGEGGMGEVYLAEQLAMNRQVALKVLHDKWNDDEEFRMRFLLEARQAGKLSHPNLIQVFDVGKYQGKYYFSMEFVDGVTVDDIIRHEKTMEIDRVINIALEVCSALKYLTTQNLVHRDIKPANILITRDNVVKLADFGFVHTAVYDRRLSQEGTTLGTPDYISPEQARGESNLDVRSDIYSLGATLFHMLSGRALYKGSCSQVMRDQIDTPPPDLKHLRSDIPDSLVRILARMLAKDPADRHQTPDELSQELEMAKLDTSGAQGMLPGATRSQIMKVISAEKERITELEEQVAAFDTTKALLIASSIIGWGLAIIFLILWIAQRR
jgi:serine/threonine-protein kinase